MNYIFFLLIVASIIYGIFNNTIENVNSAMLDSCEAAVKISISLIGIMTFWLGTMRIAEKSGLVKVIAKIISPIMRFLFKDIKKENSANGNIALSISANALGLTNAATPIGLKVMKDLQEENTKKDTATDAMCMFLGMNTAGFQIIPATVIAILVGAGAKNPTEIIIPTLIVTTLAFISAIIVSLLFRSIWHKEENND